MNTFVILQFEIGGENMKFINDNKKQLHWYNRNFFWIISIVYIALNIIIFAVVGAKNLLEDLSNSYWWMFDEIKEWLVAIGNAYSHVDWSHVLYNMLELSVCVLYLERKIGSVNLLMLLLGMTLLVPGVVSMYWGLGWYGSSVIWFALWGYVIIDFLFSLRKEKRNLANVITGGVVLLLEFILSGFYETTSGIRWVIAPYQLINNAGHLLGFAVGIIMALLVNIPIVELEKRSLSKNIQNQKEIFKETYTQKIDKACKVVSWVSIIFLILSFSWSVIYIGVQSQRKFLLSVEIDCNIDAYDTTYIYDSDNILLTGSVESNDIIDDWLSKFELPYTQNDLDIQIIFVGDECSNFLWGGGSACYVDPWGFNDFYEIAHFQITIV